MILQSPKAANRGTSSELRDRIAGLLFGLWLAVVHPLVFFALLAAMLIAVVLLLKLLWRGFRRLLSPAST